MQKPYRGLFSAAAGHLSPGQRRSTISQYGKAWFHAVLLGVSTLLVLSQLGFHVSQTQSATDTTQIGFSTAGSALDYPIDPVLVSYSYFEKDEVRHTLSQRPHLHPHFL